ncbi:predicted protein [Histoplasma capsulatum var. duboisii H88]|uniref:Predicted protein n=1 Tax=Ajellomyces capsulatus (strain H88) TaxID=544711 RepID=F0UGE8_AJEC8|nr:predicted protein [Histoplasma capsulatum var. duboisii H88]
MFEGEEGGVTILVCIASRESWLNLLFNGHLSDKASVQGKKGRKKARKTPSQSNLLAKTCSRLAEDQGHMTQAADPSWGFPFSWTSSDSTPTDPYCSYTSWSLVGEFACWLTLVEGNNLPSVVVTMAEGQGVCRISAPLHQDEGAP